MPARSGVFENQDAAIIERDFGGFLCRALIEPVWVGFRWFPVGGRWGGGEGPGSVSPATTEAVGGRPAGRGLLS